MQIDIIRTFRIFDSSSIGFRNLLLQFRNGANTFHVSILVSPYWKRSAPVSFSGDGPILDVAQPFAKSSFTDPIRCPFNAIVELEESLFNCSHSNEPGIHCVVEKWMICSPAVWVIVQVTLLSVQQARADRTVLTNQNFHDCIIT